MKTLCKYRIKYWRDYVLLFRVGSMTEATRILEHCDSAIPENKTLQHQLARIGCHLHRKGEYVPKKQHDQNTIYIS